MHPVLAVALGETDEVFVQYPIAPRQRARRRGRRGHADRRRHRLPSARDPARRPLPLPAPAHHAGRGRRDPRDGTVGRPRRCSPSSAASASSKTTTPAPSSSFLATRRRSPVDGLLWSRWTCGALGQCAAARATTSAATPTTIAAGDAERRLSGLARLQHRFRREQAADRAADVRGDRDVRGEIVEDEVDDEERPETGVPEAHALAVHHDRRGGGDAEHAARRARGRHVRLRRAAPRPNRRAPTRRRGARTATVRRPARAAARRSTAGAC